MDVLFNYFGLKSLDDWLLITKNKFRKHGGYVLYSLLFK